MFKRDPEVPTSSTIYVCAQAASSAQARACAGNGEYGVMAEGITVEACGVCLGRFMREDLSGYFVTAEGREWSVLVGEVAGLVTLTYGLPSEAFGELRSESEREPRDSCGRRVKKGFRRRARAMRKR